ncbi:MAG: homocysteine S-methyltransferase family protein, partial [Planctomycetota bacterium]
MANDSPSPLLLDGALGTQFATSGFDLERDLDGHADAWEVLSLTRPEQVRAVHESYLDAGADFIGTHTFMVLPSALEARGLADRFERLITAAAREARAAIDAWSTPERPRGVLGVLGPGLDLPSRGGRPAAAVEDEYAAAGRLLDRAEVDLLLLETCADPIQIEAAARGLRSVSERPLWISLATIDGQLPSDFSLEEAVA